MSTKDWLEKDYYKALGVAKDDDAAVIKKAYRKLARELHPDKNPGDAKAEARFKEVSEAYDVLSDKAKRAEYDEARATFAGGRMPGGFGGSSSQNFDMSDVFGQGGGGLGDIFGGMFGGGGSTRRARSAGPTRGHDVNAEVKLDFEECGARSDPAVAAERSRRLPDLPRQRCASGDVDQAVPDVCGQRLRQPQPGSLRVQ